MSRSGDYRREQFPECYADDAVEGIGSVFFALVLGTAAVTAAILLMF